MSALFKKPDSDAPPAVGNAATDTALEEQRRKIRQQELLRRGRASTLLSGQESDPVVGQASLLG